MQIAHRVWQDPAGNYVIDVYDPAGSGPDFYYVREVVTADTATHAGSHSELDILIQEKILQAKHKLGRLFASHSGN